MNITTFLIGFACAGLITGCAASIPPPAELNSARQAYARASACLGVRLVPDNLCKAREALVRAEQSFRDNPKSDRTRDLANLAHREARMAVEIATTVPDSAVDRRSGQRIPISGN